MDPTNVLRIHYNFNLAGGAEYDVLKVMQAMQTHCCMKKHLVLVAKESGKYFVAIHSDAIDRREVGLAGMGAFLRQYIESNNIAIVHIHSMPHPEVTALVLTMGLPVVRSLHDPMITCPGWARFLVKSGVPCTKRFGPLCLVRAYTEKCQRSRMPLNVLAAYHNVYREQREFIKRYRFLLVYSNYMADILKHHGAPESKIMKIPSPQFANPGHIIPQPKSGIPCLVFAGRVSRHKGILNLLQAYRDITTLHGIEIDLYVAGNGELLQQLRLQARSEALDRIHYLGWVQREDMWKMFSSDCIVVVPSIYPDNFPNVVAEAMLCGSPVVASNAGGTSEWLVDGESGLSYDVNNIRQLTEHLLQLVRDPELRQRLGTAARKRIASYHTAEIAAERYAEIYRLAIL